MVLRYKAIGWAYNIICVLLVLFEGSLIVTDGIRFCPHIFYGVTAVVIYCFAVMAVIRLVAMGKEEDPAVAEVNKARSDPGLVSKTLDRPIA